jgi:hypothetical protein
MVDSHSDRDPVEELAEEFIERHRRGQHPPLTEYTDRYPEYPEAIRSLFPALVKLEPLKPGTVRERAEVELLAAELDAALPPPGK